MRIVTVTLCFLLISVSLSVAQNSALDFDGKDDQLVGITPITQFDQFTMEIWFKGENGSNNPITNLMAWGDITTGFPHRFHVVTTNNKIAILDDASTNGFSYLFPLTTIVDDDNEWHHLAIVKKEDEISLYLDDEVGTYVTERFHDFILDPQFIIGQRVGDRSPAWNGLVDEFRMWDYAMPEADIIAARDCELEGNEAGLVQYFKFDQVVSGGGVDIIQDATPGNRDAVLNNFALTGNSSNVVMSNNPVNGPCSECSAGFEATREPCSNTYSFSANDTKPNTSYSWVVTKSATGVTNNFSTDTFDFAFDFRAAPGQSSGYEVCLTVTNSDGCTDTQCDNFDLQISDRIYYEILTIPQDITVTSDEVNCNAIVAPQFVQLFTCPRSLITQSHSRSDGLEMSDPYEIGETVVTVSIDEPTETLVTEVYLYSVIVQASHNCINSFYNPNCIYEYWFAAPKVTASHGDRPIRLGITNLEDTDANVSVKLFGNLNYQNDIIVPAGQFTVIDITDNIDIIEPNLSFEIESKGILVESDVKLQVYYEVVGSTNPNSNGGNNPEIFSLKGVSAMGNEFVVPSQNIFANRVYNPPAYEQIIILATTDSTIVEFTPSIENSCNLSSRTFQLNRGDTYMIECTNITTLSNMGGSIIKVIKGGDIVVTTADDSVISGGSDLIGDQLIPTSELGNEYLVLKGNMSTGKEAVCIVASEPGLTNVLIETDSGNTETIALNGVGGIAYFTFSNNDQIASFSSSNNFLVYQLSGLIFTAEEIGSSIIPPLTCTGSNSVGFSRTANNTSNGFYMMLLSPTSGISDFKVNGFIQDFDFSSSPISGWSYAYITGHTGQNFNFGSASNLAVATPYVITNDATKFHLGIISQVSASAEFGYFSEFGSLDLCGKAQICAGENLTIEISDEYDSYEWIRCSDNVVLSTSNSIQIDDIGEYCISVNCDGKALENSIIVEYDPECLPSDCFTVQNETIECVDHRTYDITLQIKNENDQVFDRLLTFAQNNQTAVNPTISIDFGDNMPMLPPGETSGDISFQVRRLGLVDEEIEVCFDVIPQNPSGDDCCKDDFCLTLPVCCVPDQSKDLLLTQDTEDECCYNIEISNACAVDYFNGVTVSAIGSELSIANSSSDNSWDNQAQNDGSVYFDIDVNGDGESDQVPLYEDYVLIGNICLDGVTPENQDEQALAIAWFAEDNFIETVCNDTISTACPPEPCNLISAPNVTCDNNDNYQLEFTVDFSASETTTANVIVINPKGNTVVSDYSPQSFDNITLAPGTSQTFTIDLHDLSAFEDFQFSVTMHDFDSPLPDGKYWCCEGEELSVQMPSCGIQGEPSTIGFRVIPNPVEDVFTVRFDQVISTPMYIELITLQGELLDTRHVLTGSDSYSLSMRDAIPAVYFIKVQDAEGQVSYQKILKL